MNKISIEEYNYLQEKYNNMSNVACALKIENDKYKFTIDKIKEYIKRKDLVNTNEITNGNIKYILELLEEIE